MPPKIFLFCEPMTRDPQRDQLAHALAEDGVWLGSHWSSSIGFAKHDIGLTSQWHHEEYRKHYPEGYEVEWIDADKLDSHEGFQRAYKLNQERGNLKEVEE